MKYHQIITVASCIALAACSSTSMVESSYDSTSNRLSTKIYSKYYDDGDWLIPNKLGASVVADHMKRRIPVVYGIQQSLGALGPSDSDAQAKITVYFWNFDDSKYLITDIQLSNDAQILRKPPNMIEVLPKTRTRADLGVINIFDSGKKIPITMSYTVNGKRIKQSLNLSRRTMDELRTFYGPQGKQPYPWHARVSEIKY